MMNKEINDLRNEINQIDDQIITLLEERFIITNEIGKVKKKEKLNVVDQTRETIIIKKIDIMTKNNTEVIQEIYQYIMKKSKEQQ